MTKQFTPEAGDIVELTEPDWPEITGHGPMPDGMTITSSHNGKKYHLPWGTHFKISDYCDPDGKVATLHSNSADLPLIRDGIVREYINQFTLIKKHKED